MDHRIELVRSKPIPNERQRGNGNGHQRNRASEPSRSWPTGGQNQSRTENEKGGRGRRPHAHWRRRRPLAPRVIKKQSVNSEVQTGKMLKQREPTSNRHKEGEESDRGAPPLDGAIAGEGEQRHAAEN